jgi:ATP-dependent RNA helicase DDX18/HAS1
MKKSMLEVLLFVLSICIASSTAFGMLLRPKPYLSNYYQSKASCCSLSARDKDSDVFGDFNEDEYEFAIDDKIRPYTDDDFDTNGEEIISSNKEIKNSHFFSKKDLSDPSFSKSPIFPLLCQGVNIQRPSRIQSLAWPVLLEGKNSIIADQTGSGKTLAYLIPLIQRAIEAIARDPQQRVNGSPRVLVLAPTAELADQIRSVCESLSACIPFKTMVVTATGLYKTSIRDQIRLIQRQPVDVLIGTPGRLATILRTRNAGLNLSNLQAIVLDEVDILLVDDTFGPQLRTVGVAAPKTQFVFCTATLPDEVIQTVKREFPDAVQVKGPGLHRLAPSVKEYLIDVSVPSVYNQDVRQCFDVKSKELLKSLRQHRCRRTLVFCNTVESCRAVENLLNRNDRRGNLYQVMAYHNAMTPDARNSALRVFSGSDNNNSQKMDMILICTDRAARGVDFDASPVDHVILFDFPKDPAEYVRRVGRTARAGRTGTCTVMAYGWQLPIARRIMGGKLGQDEVSKSNNMDDIDNEEIKGGAMGRKGTFRKETLERDSIIKGSIEKGQLWKNRVDKP